MANEKDINQILDEKIPRSVVSERDGGGGRRLSYLEGHYVIDRLNKVFGPLSWSFEITQVQQVTNKTSKGEFPAYITKVRLSIHSQPPCVKEAFGYGSDKSAQNAHELAIKESVTDALKVAAKNLGMSMGLALYDKTQENVSEEDEKETKQVDAKAESTEATTNGSHRGNGKDTTDEADIKKIQEAIKSQLRVAIKLEKSTIDSFKADLSSTYGVETLAALTVQQLKQVLTKMQALTGGPNVH